MAIFDRQGRASSHRPDLEERRDRERKGFVGTSNGDTLLRLSSSAIFVFGIPSRLM